MRWSAPTRNLEKSGLEMSWRERPKRPPERSRIALLRQSAGKRARQLLKPGVRTWIQAWRERRDGRSRLHTTEALSERKKTIEVAIPHSSRLRGFGIWSVTIIIPMSGAVRSQP
jgi:hypothetical protein